MSKLRRHLADHAFKGGRFADHGIVVDAVADLLRYKELLVETAKELWRAKHPERERLPKNFEDSLALKFYDVRPGSAVVPLEREFEVADDVFAYEPPPDELDEAALLVADTAAAATEDRPVPEAFPKKLLALFEDYGAALREDEWIEQSPAGRAKPARYTAAARRRLSEWAAGAYEDAVDLVGSVTMARVSRPRMALLLSDGREIEAQFRPEDEETITTALQLHRTAKLRVEGRGLFAASGQIEKIVEVERVMLLTDAEPAYDASAKPIWEIFDQILATVPPEELDKLPKDLAENHDHYIYGRRRNGA